MILSIQQKRRNKHMIGHCISFFCLRSKIKPQQHHQTKKNSPSFTKIIIEAIKSISLTSKIGSRAPTLLARRRKQEAKPRCRRRRWRQPQASEKGDPPKSGAVANRKSGATLAAAVPPTHTHYYLFDVFFYYFPLAVCSQDCNI